MPNLHAEYDIDEHFVCVRIRLRDDSYEITKKNQFSFLYLLCLQKSMNIRPQNTIGVRGRRRMIRPSAALINTVNTRKRLRRSQSVAKQIAT